MIKWSIWGRMGGLLRCLTSSSIMSETHQAPQTKNLWVVWEGLCVPVSISCFLLPPLDTWSFPWVNFARYGNRHFGKHGLPFRPYQTLFTYVQPVSFHCFHSCGIFWASTSSAKETEGVTGEVMLGICRVLLELVQLSWQQNQSSHFLSKHNLVLLCEHHTCRQLFPVEVRLIPKG